MKERNSFFRHCVAATRVFQGSALERAPLRRLRVAAKLKLPPPVVANRARQRAERVRK